MKLASGTRLGSYEVISLIGAGGMGEVYRARDARLKRDVAVKILPQIWAQDADRQARFHREAELLATLNHPNIAAIYGFEEAGGIQGLLLELVEGPTLADRLMRGPLPLKEGLSIARQIADALDAAHERGIVHRDLKPANVKVRADGTVKVLDFGLAKVLEPAPVATAAMDLPTITAHGMTQAGVIVGTPSYMSPEQARGQAVDKRTDIWAFGCVLYELLTAKRVFDGATSTDVLAAVLGREPDWSALPATTPAALKRVVRRCLEQDSKRRVRDIGDVRAELDEILTGSPVADSTPLPSRGFGGRHWRSVALGATLAAMVLGGLLALELLRSRSTVPAAIYTARAAASQLTNFGGTETSGAISPDGRSFVFVSNHGGTPDIWLRQVAGGDPVRLTNDAGLEQDLAFAPDGESLYFSRAEGGAEAIWQVGILGGQARKIIADAHSAAPSPDGRRLAYMVPGAAPNLESLAVSVLDGSDRRTVAERIDFFPRVRLAWSPDGRQVSYSRSGLFTSANLFVVEVDSGRERQVTHFTQPGESIAAGHGWLPDNRHIVVAYASANRPGNLAVLDTLDGSLFRVTATVSDGFAGPILSTDGTRLIATASRQRTEVWKVPVKTADPDANGRSAVRLLDETETPFWTFVSRDGRTLLFNGRRSGSSNLWLTSLASGSKPRQITAIGGNALTHSSLSPDGTRAAFVSFAAGNASIWSQNVDGSELRQLTKDDAADSWPVWSPDGRRIVYTSTRNGTQETRVMAPDGTGNEKLIDGFFRGDWIEQPDGTGTWIVTSDGNRGVRLIDAEERSVIWETRLPGGGLSLPVFSPDGRRISVPFQEARDRYAIQVLDVATGNGKTLARLPFSINFRAAWTDEGTALIVNRLDAISHVVLFDRFWEDAAR